MRLRSHIVLSGGTAATLGAAEAVVRHVTRPQDVGLFWSLVLAIGIVGLAGVLFGIGQAVVWRVLVRAADALRFPAWWATATDRSASERHPVRAFHGALLAAVATIAVVSVIDWWVLRSLLTPERGTMAAQIGIALLILVAVAGSLIGGVAYPGVVRIVARVDERVRFPWPPSPFLRQLLWILIPVALFLVPYLARRAEALGPYATPFWIVAFVVVERTLWLALRSLPSRRPRPAAWLRAGLLCVIGSAACMSALVTARRGPPAEHTRGNGILSSAAEILRTITDVDRDGFSSLFGGLDCAGLDPEINPGIRDAPANGIDENCDGKDALPIEDPPLALFSGALSEQQTARRDIILIVVDAVRADHTGIGGYERATTPYLDAIGRESLVFTQAHSQSSATMMSLPSILSGRDPSTMTWERAKRLEPAANERLLASRLGDLGYRTGLVGDLYVEEFLSRIQADYEWYADGCPSRDLTAPWRSGCAGGAVAQAIRFIEQMPGAPYFLTVYIEDPHARYASHDFGLSTFGREPIDRYDGELAQVDRHLGFLVGYLKATDRWDNTIMVITSDHGEEFSEHGGSHHARTCYVESTHVPLVVHAPGVPATRVDSLVALLDIAPTLLELIGATDADETLQGQSLLVPAMGRDAPRIDRVGPCAIISQRAWQGNFFRRAVRTTDWTLVHDVLSDRFELYDRALDPSEQSNVFELEQERADVQRLLGYLNDSLRGNLRSRLLTD